MKVLNQACGLSKTVGTRCLRPYFLLVYVDLVGGTREPTFGFWISKDSHVLIMYISLINI